MPEAFVSNLSDNARSSMIGLLNERLADMIDLTLAVKQAHWNLKGSSFIGIHELLDDVAERCRDHADLMAERCVIIGGQAKGTSQVVAAESSLDAYPVDAQHFTHHVAALKDRFMAAGAKLREGIDAAGEAGDEDTADLFTEVSRSVDKDAWFIGAHNATGDDAPATNPAAA